jgi:hypothetical membrane protein
VAEPATVTGVTAGSRRTMAERSTLSLTLASAFLFGTVALSDIADSQHSVIRDPVSFFGSPTAPYPALFNGGLAALGVSTVAWALVWRHRLPTTTWCLLGAIGVLAAFLALWPIDCSPADELCEVLIRGRVVSRSHNLHSVVALGFFVSLALLASVERLRANRTRGTIGSQWRRSAAAGATVLATILLVARPFSAGAGVLELVVLASAATTLYRLASLHDA